MQIIHWSNFSCIVLKTRAERADDLKEELILQKQEKEDAKTKAQKDMLTYANRQEEYQEESTQTINAVQVQWPLEHLQGIDNKLDEVNEELTIFCSVQNRILELGKRRRNLLDKLRRCQVELEAKRDESVKLRQKFKVAMKKVFQLSPVQTILPILNFTDIIVVPLLPDLY